MSFPSEPSDMSSAPYPALKSPPLSQSGTLLGSSDPPIFSPSPECFHLAMEGENVSATIVPCQEHPGMNRRTVFGVKLSGGRPEKENDPFNYEHKYPEDDPYKEMAEDSRFWKTCIDEAAKVDANKVADWTDALDVLLVFAGLFSGVVSTFVCQTFQNLQVEPTDLIYLMMNELLDVQRAIDEYGAGSSKRIPRSDTSFHASRTAIWVNTLWFVSLTLSLTTALIAVVTKQWIHQYMDFTHLGTPRARARVRHFRFIQLQAWHVPAIIGLLPVLMHIALGVFLAGLVLLIRSLSTPAAAVVGLMVFFALLAYVGTNLFPVYDPSCPYKTPLSMYAFMVFFRIHRSISPILLSLTHAIASLFTDTGEHDSGSSAVTAMPGSLVSAEEQLVTRSLDLLDAQTAAWLYTASSNSSVQYITIQALSDSPLHVARSVKDRIGEQALEVALKRVVQSPEFVAPERQGAFDRSVRTLLRLFPTTRFSAMDVRPEHRGPNSLALLLDMNNPDPAVDVIVAEILRPASIQYDAVVWAHILNNAFGAGADWLEYNLEHSKVWRNFVCWFLGSHTCSLCPYKSNTDSGIYSLISYKGQDIIIMDNDNTSTSPDKPMCLMSAATNFMAPSLCDLILLIAYPSFERFDDVPSDVQLHLALIRTEWVLKTSRSSGSSLVSSLIGDISCHVGVGRSDDAHTFHKGVEKATFHALKSVIADTFATDMLSLRDRQRLVHPFFRCLSGEDTLILEYQKWITGAIADMIIDAVFMGPRALSETFPLLVDLLVSAVRSECQILLPKVCIQLCENEWLDAMASILFGEDELSVEPEVRQSYASLAAAFVDAIHILKDLGHPVYNDVTHYAQKPHHLLCLSKMLLLSNAETRRKLWCLVPLVEPSLWTSCLQELESFVSNECRRLAYKDLVTTPLLSSSLAYDTRREELPKLLTRFTTHVLTHDQVECVCRMETVATEESRSSKLTQAWWRRLFLCPKAIGIDTDISFQSTSFYYLTVLVAPPRSSWASRWCSRLRFINASGNPNGTIKDPRFQSEFEEATIGRYIFETLRNMLGTGAGQYLGRFLNQQVERITAEALGAIGSQFAGYATAKAGAKAAKALMKRLADAFKDLVLPEEWFITENKVKSL